MKTKAVLDQILLAIADYEAKGGAATICIDSRQADKNSIFFALAPEQKDRQTHVQGALAAGVLCAVASGIKLKAEGVIDCDNALRVLDDFADLRRSLSTATVAAITGSAGKTTVRGLAQAWLSAGTPGAVQASRSSFNNQLGVSVTLAGLNSNHQYLVAEAGTNAPGEISALAARIKPDIALVLNASEAHLKGLGSVQGVANEKGSLYKALPAKGTAVIPADSPFADMWRRQAQGRRIITFAADAPPAHKRHTDADLVVGRVGPDTFKLHTSEGSQVISCPLPGDAAASALAGAAALVVAAGQNPLENYRVLADFSGEPGRLRRYQRGDGKVVFDDTYNANPASMRNALDCLAGESVPTIAVLGAMGELGDNSRKLHQKTGVYARRCGIDQIWALGEEAKHYTTGFKGGRWFASRHDLDTALVQLFSGNRPVAVLFKGSRFMKMEDFVPQSLKTQDYAG